MSRARWSLIGLQIFYVLFIPVWLLFAGFAVMWFDAPGSENVGWLVGLFYLTWAYPIALIGTAVAGWILYARHRFTAAVRWSLVPLLWVAPILGIFLYANLS